MDPQFKILDQIDPKGRIKAYISQAGRAHDPSYQARQSKIAVGSGGVLGAGLMQGKQKILKAGLPRPLADRLGIGR